MRRKRLWTAAMSAVMVSVALSGMPVGVPAADSAAEVLMEETFPSEEDYEEDDTDFSDDLHEELPDVTDEDAEASDEDYPEDDEEPEVTAESERPEPEAAGETDSAEVLAESTVESVAEEMTEEEHFAKGDLLITTDASVSVLETAGLELTEVTGTESVLKQYWIAGAEQYSFAGIPEGRQLEIRTEKTALLLKTEVTTSVTVRFEEDGTVKAAAAADGAAELAVTRTGEEAEEEIAAKLSAGDDGNVSAEWKASGETMFTGAASIEVDYDLTSVSGEELFSSSIHAQKTEEAASYRYFQEDEMSFLVLQ
ncbi:MAG: hypothetical protein Q4B09_09545 [Lachnospiraceae bacterium]|nr:hypothetical protein [Lachnospiraceae bacterium]